jgi:foldase protein PrsA
MGKLSAIQNILIWLKNLAVIVWEFLSKVYVFIWGQMQLRLPFIRALVRRHTQNPATIFIDIALAILSLYIIFGVVGYVLVYPQKSEHRFTETLSVLYPLPAAKVNNSLVWGHKFLERLRFLNTFNQQAPKDGAAKPPTDAELRQRVLEGLIEDQIIFLEAKKRGIRVTEDELQRALEAQGKSEDIVKKINELYGMSLGNFKEIIAEQILKEKVKNTVLTRVRVRHILVSSNQAATAAKNALGAGRDFADVAKEFSQDAKTKDAGGDLGYWRKGELAVQVSPAFEESAFGMQVNQVSDAVPSPFGFHIVQITERSGDNLQTYEEWYKQLLPTYQVKRYITI